MKRILSCLPLTFLLSLLFFFVAHRTDAAELAAANLAKASPQKKPLKAAPAQEEPEPTATPPSTPPKGSSPLADLKNSNTALKKLFQRAAPSWSPESDAKRSEMRKLVNGFLDYEELAHRSLIKHWDSLSIASRKEFVAVLRDLIERRYIQQVHGQPNYDLQFDKETIEEHDATVFATLKTTNKGKKYVIAMEYKLLYKGKRWLVYDVITDEQSMLEIYRAEFNKIIAKESFDALLKRMKKRLEKPE
jgi:phospholipid transport system substrate-binding protein